MSMSKEMNLSLAGCGFLGIYHVGVATCFKQYAPNILVNKISGASAGALAACSLLCGVSMGQVTSDVLKVATMSREYTFGAFSPGFNINEIIRNRLDDALPENAHQICSGRLHISVTRVSDGKNVILSDFATRDELIQAVLCSTFIPLFSGLFPEKFRGVRYIDGCYSNNLPILDENTVTVSPFCGESDICPQDNSYNLFQVNFNNTSIELSPQNFLRFVQILFPPEVEILSDMCKQGFDDALRFLQRNSTYCTVCPHVYTSKYMVSCVRCIAVSSELELRDDDDDDDDEEDDNYVVYDDGSGDESECDECTERRLMASVDDFPDTVLTVLEDAALSMNSGLISWVFKHKTMRVLSVLTLPYVLPIDIAKSVYGKFKELVPKMNKDLNKLAHWLSGYVHHYIKRWSGNAHLYGAKFSCELAITEYEIGNEPRPVRLRSRSVVAGTASRRSSLSHRPLSGDFSCPHRARRNQSSNAPRRMSSVNVGFTVAVAGNVGSTTKPLAKALDAGKTESRVVDLTNTALTNMDSRSLTNQGTLSPETADTFDQVLQVTRHQESVLSYYYLNGENVKVQEIFDVSNPDVGVVFSPEETEANRRLEWDEEYTDFGVEDLDDNLDDVYDFDENDEWNSVMQPEMSQSYLSLVDPGDILSFESETS